MKNKIGILTFHYPINNNFGAALQSFAVSKMIEKQGYEMELIDLIPKKETLKQKILFNICGKKFEIYSKKFLRTTNKCETKDDLKKLNTEFSAFIVGSDQVWRPVWLGEYLPHYYFDFVDDDKKKIAYAASFGVDRWEGEEPLTSQIKKLAQRFDYISVREESGIKICKDTFDVDAVCVLDPTLVIDREDYQIILEDYKDTSHRNKKYIAHMLLDDTEELKVGSQKIADYLKAEVNHIKGRPLNILGKKLFKYNGVSQWLTYVKDSELVITDSFHCAVFSLIFNKKFVVVANPVRGMARLETLLSKVGLEDRFFTNIEDVMKSGILNQEIDYKEVERKLQAHREFSLNFLKNALNG